MSDDSLPHPFKKSRSTSACVSHENRSITKRVNVMKSINKLCRSKKWIAVINIRIGLLSALLSLLCACGSKPVERPKITYLDSPREKRSLTIDLPKYVDVSGFKKAVIKYVIENERQCVPIDKTIAVGGVWPGFQETRNIEMSNSNGVLAGNYYLEAIRSEDYYGLGICNWRPELLDITTAGHPRVRIVLGKNEISRKSQIRLACKEESLLPGWDFFCFLPAQPISVGSEIFAMQINIKGEV